MIHSRIHFNPATDLNDAVLGTYYFYVAFASMFSGNTWHKFYKRYLEEIVQFLLKDGIIEQADLNLITMY